MPLPVPKQQGHWPAFWLIPVTGLLDGEVGGAAGTEIDIMEKACQTDKMNHALTTSARRCSGTIIRLAPFATFYTCPWGQMWGIVLLVTRCHATMKVSWKETRKNA